MKNRKTYEKALYLYNKIYFLSKDLSKTEKLKLHKKYVELIRKCAYSGNPKAQFDLGQEYENMNFVSINNPNFNAKKRFYWYKKAVEQNHAEACNNLAHLYETGEGCKKNIKLALRLYKKSANLGYDIGKKNYKIMLKQLGKAK